MWREEVWNNFTFTGAQFVMTVMNWYCVSINANTEHLYILDVIHYKWSSVCSNCSY
jgi:hypothetical protein